MTSSPERLTAGSRRTRLLATCAPGLRRVLQRELECIDGVEVTGTGFDGRSDIVFAVADRAGREAALRLRLADEILAEIGRASRTIRSSQAAAAGRAGPAAVAAAALEPAQFERALSVWAQEVRPLRSAMTFAVTALVLPDSTFPTAVLRDALTAEVSSARPRWRAAIPSQLEVRLCEWHDGQYVAALLLADASAHGHRSREASGLAGGRPETDSDDDIPSGTRVSDPASATQVGTVRRSIAAAMVHLAGPPVRARHTLLDPCCGDGAILTEALAAGWYADGMASDPADVRRASSAAPQATVELGDPGDLLLPDATVAACVSVLPSGPATDGWQNWTSVVLAEIGRVTRSGGPVVLLGRDLQRSASAATLRLRRQIPLRLPGTPSIWVFRRS